MRTHARISPRSRSRHDLDLSLAPWVTSVRAPAPDRPSASNLVAISVHSQDNFISAVRAGRGERLQAEKAAALHHETSQNSLGKCAGWLGKPGKRTLRKMVDEGTGLFDGSVSVDHEKEPGKSDFGAWYLCEN